jgi:hypothetical protein
MVCRLNTSLNSATDQLTFEHQPVEAALVVKHDAIRISERMHPLHYSVTSQASGIRAVCMMRATQHCDPWDCAASANGGCVTSVEELGRKREIAQPPLTRWCPPLACVKGLYARPTDHASAVRLKCDRRPTATLDLRVGLLGDFDFTSSGTRAQRVSPQAMCCR